MQTQATPTHRSNQRLIRALLWTATLAVAAVEPARAIDPEPDPEPNLCVEDTTGTLSATPATLVKGETATLQWAVDAPSYCSVQVSLVSPTGEIRVPKAGTRAVVASIVPRETWALKVSSQGNSSVLASASFGVSAELPLPPDKDVYINRSTPAHASLLKRALEVGGKNVILAGDVDMDLTGMAISIGHDTTLTSSAPRSATSPGPRLYVRDRPRPALLIRCFDNAPANVSINGIRLQGPHWNSANGDDNLERGIMVDSCRGVDIANNEIFGWSGQGVFVQDTLNNLQLDADIQVHDNYFHHNQHIGGNGYGVESSHGGKVLIERNVFDYNRHAIAAAGGWSPGSRYTARHNLVLKGGGFHDHYPIYGDWYTHQFDVHGTTDCGPLFFNAQNSCGEAGIYFEWSDNAMQYTKGASIKVRGNPVFRPLAARNVFAASSSSAIQQNGEDYQARITTPVTKVGNRHLTDSYGKFGVCDIDGDGTDDLFLATGANWWYSSAGKHPWTYLRAATEQLHQLGLGDFDGDGKCDVVAGNPFEISRGAKEAWQPLAANEGAPMSELYFGNFNEDPRADIFRRDPNGQWWLLSPGYHDGWQPLQSSGIALKNLRFGHFNHDNMLDVIAVVNGKWHVSWGANSAWERLNPTLGSSLTSQIVIGDIDGNGIDDVIRYSFRSKSPLDSFNRTTYLMDLAYSKDGIGAWAPLTTMTLTPSDIEPKRPTSPGDWAFATPQVGKFLGAQSPRRLLVADRWRLGHLFNFDARKFTRHSLNAY